MNALRRLRVHAPGAQQVAVFVRSHHLPGEVSSVAARREHDSWVAEFEAAITRLGEDSKMVLLHDVAQIDNRFVSRHDGIAAAVARLVGEPTSRCGAGR